MAAPSYGGPEPNCSGGVAARYNVCFSPEYPELQSLYHIIRSDQQLVITLSPIEHKSSKINPNFVNEMSKESLCF